MNTDELTPYQISLIRDALGQSGSPQGAMLAGGLLLGPPSVQSGPGDAALSGSIRRSTELGAGVQRATAQTIPPATWTPVSFSNVLWDSDGCADLVGSPALLTIRTGGVYSMMGRVQWDGAAGGIYLVAIVTGAGVFAGVAGWSFGATPDYPIQNVFTIWPLNSGDTVSLQVYQDTGGPKDLFNSYIPTFAIVRAA